MPRYAVVQSDTEDDNACTPTDEMSEAGSDASDDTLAHHPILGTFVEAVELALRNVPLHGDHLSAANEALEHVRWKSNVLFHQALSPRWPHAFVRVLKEARMVRVCHLFGDQPTHLLNFRSPACCMCKKPEPECWVAFQLIGGTDMVGKCKDLAKLTEMVDEEDELRFSLVDSHGDQDFLGTFYGGRRCFDLAMAAVVARNLVSDTCYIVHRSLQERLQNDPKLHEQLQTDELDLTRVLYALTDVPALAVELEERITMVGDVLRGRPFPDGKIKQTGCDYAWSKLNTALSCKFGSRDGDRLAFCADRARHNIYDRTGDYSYAESTGDEEESEDELVPPPPPPSPPVSSRTRAARQPRSTAPVSSRTRARVR